MGIAESCQAYAFVFYISTDDFWHLVLRDRYGNWVLGRAKVFTITWTRACREDSTGYRGQCLGIYLSWASKDLGKN